jgi:CDP-diacylglycerol--serine O-phosphatidyltransferase
MARGLSIRRLFYYFGGEGRFPDPSIMVAVVALALFMVSSIKYYSFKDLHYFLRKPFMSFVLIVVILVIVVAEPQIMLFTFALGYSLSGPVWTLCRLGRKMLTEFRARKSQCQDHPL